MVIARHLKLPCGGATMLLLQGLMLFSVRAADARAQGVPLGTKSVPGAELFASNLVRRVRLELTPAALASLRQESRKYVSATVREGDDLLENVGLHLKGATGSFRSIDDKPALTLNFAAFTPAQRFHGLRKIHLNNSVEDPSYLNENLGGELFRAAGVPAPRVAYALVELNGRKLGLYVLKEGFTKDFLGLYFRKTNGNLYQAGAGHDVNEALKRDGGVGPEDRSDLQALAAAALDPDLGQRWVRLQRVLEVDRFVSFMAMEVMVGHRDGYCLARNNFRIYHDHDTDKLLFFPQGMDQLFGKADLTWQPHMAGVVANALMETPEGRRRYRERFAFLLTNVFNLDTLTTRVDQLVAQIQPALSHGEARALTEQARFVKERIIQRKLSLARQISAPELPPLSFQNGVARLTAWQAVDVPAKGAMEIGQAPDGKPALRISAGPNTAASWRTRVLLEHGRYRLEGAVETTGVVPLNYGKNKGAGLRVSGYRLPMPHSVTGDTPWKKLEVEFTVTAPSEEVELLCELRAGQGVAWFDLASLRLLRLD